jgi:hypothetical protein
MAKMMGADNPAYRGGVTRLRVLIRNNKMYKQWKELVYQRDRYKCVDCGYFGDRRTLECHHVDKEFAEILQEFIAKYPQYELPKDEQRLLSLASVYSPFWSVKNGISLCAPCHKERHRILKEQNGKLS